MKWERAFNLLFVVAAIVVCYLVGRFFDDVNRLRKVAEYTYQLEERDNMEYQIMLMDSTIVIWNNLRHVGTLQRGQDKVLDSIFLKDNQ